MDWIRIQNGTPDLVESAVLSYGEIFVPYHPKVITIFITPLVRGGFGLTFSEKLPAYPFTNLLAWLDSPPEIDGVYDAMGWYQANDAKIRYALRMDEENEHGDTMIGVPKSGPAISIYLPSIYVCPLTRDLACLHEPRQPDNKDCIRQFELTLDSDEQYENNGLSLTHLPDSRW